MAYTLREGNDAKIVSSSSPRNQQAGTPENVIVAEKNNVSGQEDDSGENPFLELTSLKKEENQQDNKEEQTIDMMNIIGKRERQKIQASPDMVLAKKKVNKNSKGMDVLNRFAGPQNEANKTNCQPPEEKSISLESSVKNPAEAPRSDSKNEQENKTITNNKEITNTYNSPRHHACCCDTRNAEIKIVSCQCIII